MTFEQCEKCGWIHSKAAQCCPWKGRAASVTFGGETYYNPSTHTIDALNKAQHEQKPAKPREKPLE